jgi:hypothetical protein
MKTCPRLWIINEVSYGNDLLNLRLHDDDVSAADLIGCRMGNDLEDSGSYLREICYNIWFPYIMFFLKKALTVLRGHLAYPNGLLELHIETFGRTLWPGDQPDARPLPTQDNTTQKHVDTHPCPKQDSNLRSQCSSGRSQSIHYVLNIK